MAQAGLARRVLLGIRCIPQTADRSLAVFELHRVSNSRELANQIETRTCRVSVNGNLVLSIRELASLGEVVNNQNPVVDAVLVSLLVSAAGELKFPALSHTDSESSVEVIHKQVVPQGTWVAIEMASNRLALAAMRTGSGPLGGSQLANPAW